ncbi:MAG: DUF4237 domain-containing protein [Bacteroidales bacterium]|jgi:hypothetical protein|nr:DUF4237 domain-containing protein [Bacteroidales bacterium]
MKYLMPGEIITRYGGTTGRYFSPKGTPLYMRSLPPNANVSMYNSYTVLKPISVESGLISPAFGQIGLGTQYLSPVSAEVLLKHGFIKSIPK